LPLYREVLIVPVSIAGDDHLFVLDSGASTNVFDSDLKHVLGEPLRQVDATDIQGKQLEAEAFAPPVAHVGEIAVTREAPVACFDLTPIRAAVGREISGILGMPFFATNIIQIDFDQRELRIFSTSTEPRAEWGKPIIVVFTDSNLPVVNSRFSTYGEEPCVVDLGYSSTLSVRSGLYDYLLSSNEILRPIGTQTTSLGGNVKSQKGLLSEFEFAGHIHKSLPAVRSESAMSSVGLDYFRRYLVTFDLSRGQLYLAKGFHFNDLEEDKTIGVAILREDGRTVVKDVVSKSPAEYAGLKKNDELVSVAGKETTGKPLAEIRWMISTAVKTRGNVEAAIRRGGLTQSVTVKAAE
jgi:hypothetical protein